ncbi:hypothetical protein ABPG75_010558 [Micractinium tetrahymenae]
MGIAGSVWTSALQQSLHALQQGRHAQVSFRVQGWQSGERGRAHATSRPERQRAHVSMRRARGCGAGLERGGLVLSSTGLLTRCLAALITLAVACRVILPTISSL